MTISIEESIQRLKAEIIAQDWRLSPKRSEQLEAAFSCLKQRFKTRKATHAMLMMAASVLAHIKKHGAQPPETIDFIKEAMAHVVGLYEDLTFDPEKEDKVFKGLYKRFAILKKKITASHSTQTTKTTSEESTGITVPRPHEPEAEQDENLPDSAPPTADTPIAQEEATLSTSFQEQVDSGNARQLVLELKNSLEKAGEVGTTIGQILQALLETQGQASSRNKVEPTATSPEPAPVPTPTEQDESPPPPKEIITPEQRLKECPATQLTIMKINGASIAIEEETISLVRPIPPSKSKTYIKQSNVPLKDFGGFMRGISSQFNGSLAKMRDSKLRQLTLPIMSPQGIAFSDVPDEEATSLVVISKGSWHGVLACSEVNKEPGTMVQFEQHQNGDIAGCGHLEDKSQIPLLDALSILKREGFLLTA